MRTFLFYLKYTKAYGFAALTLMGGFLGGGFTYLGLAAVFIVHPLLDNLLQKEHRIPAVRPESKMEMVVIGAAFPFLCVFLAMGLYLALKAHETFELVGLTLSFGSIMGVLGINSAHELVHRSQGWLRQLGRGILVLVNFTHWEVEHVYGHHKNIGTPLDPATARKNEWIYSYFVRSYFGGLKDAFLIEHRRLGSGSSMNPIPFLRNRVVGLGLIQSGLSFLVYRLYGSDGVVFWLGQSVVAILLLQTIDYVEHYGLQRQRHEDGTFEPVRAHHSWDCYQGWTNYTLINLGFHSHHHQKASLAFNKLREQEGARVLPYGYSAMALMALVPPLFFRVIHPLLDPDQGVAN